MSIVITGHNEPQMNGVYCPRCGEDCFNTWGLFEHLKTCTGNRLIEVEVNGLSLCLFPHEDVAAIIAEVEAYLAEKEERPGLGLAPDAAWTPVSEVDSMDADLVALRCGLVRPYAAISNEALEEIEDEAIGQAFSIEPYYW